MTLRKVHSEDALAALLNSTNQSDARVRRQVVDDLTGFYRQSVKERIVQLLQQEANPDILRVAIEALGNYQGEQIDGLLLEYLRSDSYRNELANAAIRAMRSQAKPSFAKPLQEILEEKNLTSRGLAAGLGTLAYLFREEKNKEPVREFLLSRVNAAKREVQVAAIGALGSLGDETALSVLETFTQASEDSPQRRAAERAVRQLREDRPASVELGRLRDEVLELQKANRELREALEDLKKQVQAQGKAKEAKESEEGEEQQQDHH